MDYISPSLQLQERWVTTPDRLPEDVSEGIRSRALAVLRDVDPLLPHVLDIKLVRNQRKNFLNIRIRNEYMRLIHSAAHGDVLFLFMPVYTLEPYVRVVALHRSSGELRQLSKDQRGQLISSVADFIRHNGIQGEKYCASLVAAARAEYPKLAECLDTSQGQPFALYIRIASAMYRRKLPIIEPLPYDAIRALLPSLGNDRWTAVQKLTQASVFLRTLLDVRGSASGVQIEVNRNYVPTLYAVEKEGVLFGFFASDKLEPYVIVSVIGAEGRLHRLSQTQLAALVVAIDEFKAKYGISNEQYHYTPLGEREETDKFVKGGGADMRSKAHSSHFHLKIRIATKMYVDSVPLLRLVDFTRMRAELEPVRYNYSRESASWADTLAAMRKDAL